jgi:methylase of polypeptide subunit release factors
MATETFDKGFGAIYTPEYIARFFARYLRNRLPLTAFQRLKILDPTCGSGIFLRAFLELQNEALLEARTTESVAATFDNVFGVDVDPNACHAARLSLSLLSLVLLDDDIRDVSISNDSVLAFQDETHFPISLDVVVANPPYVKVEAQSSEVRTAIANILAGLSVGRPDLYLAIIKIAIDLLKPGGYGLFVLPETFLKSDSARGVRSLLASTCWIHCIVDLTAVRIFEDVGVYTILLIFQKRTLNELAPRAKIARCEDLVAQALQDILDDRTIETPFYTVHQTSQDAFAHDEWSLATPAVSLILRKYALMGELGSEVHIRQGMNTGADDVFVIAKGALLDLELEVFRPLLTDREMEVYSVPLEVQSYVFYPYQDDELLTDDAIRHDFPKTWAYLETHRARLESRSAVRKEQLAWWKPERPREPRNMLRPKLVTPHLVITPKFALDALGKYAISRAPMMFSRLARPSENGHQLYLLGILNSTPCFWHITHRAHTYERGYSRLESSRLRGTRIPT